MSRQQSDAKQYIQPKGVVAPTQPYTHVIRVGNVVYVAGQVPIDEKGEVVGPGNPSLQAQQCWKNISLCLASAGASLEDVVKVVCYFSDIRHVKYELDVRRRLFRKGRYPVVSLLEAAKVGSSKDNILMEIEVTAVIP